MLIVDDHKTIRTLVRMATSRAEFTFFEADSAETALPIIQRERPDVVLLDICMTGEMSGLELCQYIKSGEYPDTFVCLISSLNSEQDVVAGEHAGADGYLVKPFHLHDLDAMIKKGVAHQTRHANA